MNVVLLTTLQVPKVSEIKDDMRLQIKVSFMVLSSNFRVSDLDLACLQCFNNWADIHPKK
jgi:hypothetical protein